MQTALILIGLFLNTTIVGVGIYLSSYLKKKAQNLATREEFKELQKQTAELTRTTAQIEAEISGTQWDRQKRWELKREVLFELTKRVAAAFVALKNLQTLLQLKLQSSSVLPPAWEQDRIDGNEKWFQAKQALDESRLFVGVTCGESIRSTLDRYIWVTTSVAAKINSDNGDIYSQTLPEIRDLSWGIQDAVREELGISGSEQR
jgi:hypothetical protein